jgi:hypothetical protein
MDVFDDDHTSIEELVVALRDKTLPELEGISNAAVFRYGYISKDGKVLSSATAGDEYFVGSVDTVRPSYQTNGAMVTLSGMSLAPSAPPYPVDKKNFYGLDTYHIIRMVCDHMGWQFVSLLDPSKYELGPGEIPAPLLDTQQGIDSTEEQPRNFVMGQDETPFGFVQRMCEGVRGVDPKYPKFGCRLEYRSAVVDSDVGGKSATKPQGYLYFGPIDVLKKPIRKYVYMRDPTSDVISFDPAVLMSVALTSGAAGSVTVGQDAQRGEMAVHEYTEVDRMMKYFGNRRPRFGRIIPPETGTEQEGPPEEETTEPRYEGGTTGPCQLAPPTKRDPDAPDVEQNIPLNNRFFADQRYMDYWLTTQMYSQTANLEIVGDPTLYVTANVAVFLLAPQEGHSFKLHWVSGVWVITALSHNISGGSYTTTVSLNRNGTSRSTTGETVEVRAEFNNLLETLDAEALQHLTGT